MTDHDRWGCSRGYAAAGAVSATLWAAQQPLDRRIFRYAYDDVAFLGMAVTQRDPAWRIVGSLAHAANGAVFGLAYARVRERTPRIDPVGSALAMAMLEHVTLFPLTAVADRIHPAIRNGRHPPMFSRRAFAQATWRHALFGLLLGLAARRLDRRAGRSQHA